MRLVSATNSHLGKKLAHPIYTNNGLIFIRQGQELTPNILMRIRILGIVYIYVEETFADDISLDLALPDDVRLKIWSSIDQASRRPAPPRARRAGTSGGRSAFGGFFADGSGRGDRPAGLLDRGLGRGGRRMDGDVDLRRQGALAQQADAVLGATDDAGLDQAVGGDFFNLFRGAGALCLLAEI